MESGDLPVALFLAHAIEERFAGELVRALSLEKHRPLVAGFGPERGRRSRAKRNDIGDAGMDSVNVLDGTSKGVADPSVWKRLDRLDKVDGLHGSLSGS
ncbi:hypothetical protein Bcep1808_2099 [Burkholderia vietnamiensis G4]|uniref:Uncharacterized protein n=1 Tax=Burkholderia vietnamiensis (strain G4 / LMG 22486) TaxID=269482 RepID=A4JFP8_BURVG|nr:hypothetical protein Bcep1808_2099 [Burkholderia vietnamiensis G4]